MIKQMGLSPQEHAAFIAAIESLINIKTPEQLIEWTQCEFHTLFPHEIFIFGVGRISATSIQIGRMLIGGFPVGYVHATRRADGEVASPIMAKWCREAKPQLFDPQFAHADVPQTWFKIFQHYRLRNMAAHGMRDLNSNVATYFVFSRIPDKLTPHHAYLLELLVPHMHVALVKVLSQIKLARHKSSASNLKLSPREIEILHWLRFGKTNWEISQILGLSEHTIKNQVRNILVKLQVHTRAEAVAKAISMKMISAK